MTRAKEIRDLVIDEVSLVDKGANQHAKTIIAKRAEQEDNMDEYFDGAGNLVDLDALAEGDHVWNAAGEEFVFDTEDEDEPVEEKEPELVVAKSAFLNKEPVAKSAKSLTDQVREELSKALTDKDRDAVISKALGKVEEFEQIAKRAEAAAVAERDLRLTREYTEVAKGYNVPVKPEELGRVLKRLAEVLPVEDQEVIKKCLDATSASEDLFREYGNRGGGDNADVLTQVDSLLSSTVIKSGESREQFVADVFETNPDAYDQYLAERSGR